MLPFTVWQVAHSATAGIAREIWPSRQVCHRPGPHRFS